MSKSIQLGQSLKSAESWWNANGRTVLGLGATALALYLVFRIVKVIDSVIPSWGKDKKEEEQKQKATAEKDLKQLASNGIVPSFPASQYDNLAAQVDGALKNWFGTDESALRSVFKTLKNNADFVALSNAYGIKRLEYTLYWGNMAANIQADLRDQPKFRDELNAILKSKGISFTV